MIILNNNKMKIKLSSVLLIGLVILLIGSMFASNYILKKEYLIASKQNDFPYTELSNQRFKHLKLIQDLQEVSSNDGYGLLSFEYSDSYSVKSVPTEWFVGGIDTITTKIVDDTLIVRLSHYANGNYESHANFNLRIKAPKIESVTCVNSRVISLNLIQDNIQLNLFGNSSIVFGKKFKNLISIEANLNDNTELILDNQLIINKLDVTMKDKSKLKMPTTQVQNFKLKADEGTFIEAQSKFFNTKLH